MTKEPLDIFVLDDDLDICIMANAILKYAGYNVQYTSVAEKLLPSLEKVEPKLLLMDMLLSGMDGRDICKTLKADTDKQHIKIIMMSAHPDADRSCREAGADDFLAKPFDLQQFLGKVEALLK